MRNNDTITCAVTMPGSWQAKQTASVFRSVGAEGWGNGCCEDNNVRVGSKFGCESRAGRSGNGCCEGSNVRTGGKPCCNEGTAFGTGNGCCEGNNPRTGGKPCCNEGTAFGTGNGCCEGGNPRTGGKPCCNESATFGTGNGCCEGGNGRKGSRTAAMVYEEEHELDLFCEEEEAIRKGTLFTELYMPMNGECADNCGAKLCDGQAEAFAAWELRLYLNTHPNDWKALQMFRRYCCSCNDLSYASAFVCDDGQSRRWNWTDAPWPWEFNCGCE